ncbi:hypothetical protein Q3G72_021802 [Acer saccharum]|nr:hypothetical protein Q3G72_021802 [Acer saccharum]
MTRHALLCAVLLAATAAFASAKSPAEVLGEGEAYGTAVDGHPPLRVSLLSDAAVVTPGDVVRLGLYIQLDPGWHIYWQQPGAAGLSTKTTWRSGHALMGEMAWPAPEVFRESDGVVTYGYAGETLLWAPATISDSVVASLPIEAHMQYLACNIICSPGELTVRRTLAVGEASVPADSAVHNIFERYEKRLPIAPAAAGLRIETVKDPQHKGVGEDFSIQVGLSWLDPNGRPAIRFRREAFIFDATDGFVARLLGARAATDASSTAFLSFRGRVEAVPTKTPGAAPQILSGIVQLEAEQGPLQPVLLHVALPPVAAAAEPQGAPSTSEGPAVPQVLPHVMLPKAADGDMSIGYALLLALLGGLILNLMPCVLPVLALKVVGMAQIHQQTHARRSVLLHGLAYTAGVVVSLVALASVVCALRAAGTAVGWGFQFQQPWFVASVASILVLFAMNCFGVFELYVGDAGLGHAAHKAQGLKRSAFDGVLAVVLATPCSAPFLGTAIAFALQQRALFIYLIFTSIGLGLALPYVLLTAMPANRRFVPKPGAWMLHLKTLLGFGLLLTAVWLVWIMGRFAGVDGMASLLVVLVFVGLCAWVFGRLVAAKPSQSLAYFGVLLAVLAAIHILGLRQALDAPKQDGAYSSSLPQGWQAYSQTALDAALERKQPVFVDFTADWCLTCKYNESHVLKEPALLQSLHDKHVLMLRADWTRPDETIRTTLLRFGRAGVPMYLLYHPDSPQMPQLLPELLSTSQLRDAVDNLP